MKYHIFKKIYNPAKRIFFLNAISNSLSVDWNMMVGTYVHLQSLPRNTGHMLSIQSQYHSLFVTFLDKTLAI